MYRDGPVGKCREKDKGFDTSEISYTLAEIMKSKSTILRENL